MNSYSRVGFGNRDLAVVTSWEFVTDVNKSTVALEVSYFDSCSISEDKDWFIIWEWGYLDSQVNQASAHTASKRFYYGSYIPTSRFKGYGNEINYPGSTVQINVRACLSSKKWLFPLQMNGILGRIKPNRLVGERRTRYPGIFLTKGCQLSTSVPVSLFSLRTGQNE